MPSWTKPLQRLFSKDWFLALILLGVYLATNRYVYAWDDQHLEIPLLKHLIDPTLYQGDYYVESLARNFTSYLFPILAKTITVAQIPATYLVLFLLSRYFFFYWSLKLWDLLSRKYFGTNALCSPQFAAFCAGAISIMTGRTEEFLYRTFSHQEFALGIIMAAIYYFFKERFILAAILFGVAANFHALYALFPMIYMSVYLLFFHPKDRILNCVKTGVTFVLACSPFLMWAIPHNIDLHMKTAPDLTSDWIAMYYLACPQNFPFASEKWPEILGHVKTLLLYLNPFIQLVVIYVFHLIFNPPFRQDRKIRSIAITVAGFIAVCFYFAYGDPKRFALDLNLIRNEQYLRFLLMGYTGIFVAHAVHSRIFIWQNQVIARNPSGVTKQSQTLSEGIASTALRSRNDDRIGIYDISSSQLGSALVLSFMIMSLWFQGPVSTFLVSAAILLLTALNWNDLRQTWAQWKLAALTAVVAFIAVVMFQACDWSHLRFDKVLANGLMLAILGGYIAVEVFTKGRIHWRKIFMVVPLLLAFVFFCYYHYQYVQITTKGGGFWQLQRNWEDMQRYVHDNTPKDALIMTPYNMEMGGFRIQSERKVLVCYRDTGIVGFDYQAALEWRQRVKDIEAFKVITDPSAIGPALINGLSKYNVDYIVFMRYYAPGNNSIVQKVYENEVFELYKVLIKQ